MKSTLYIVLVLAASLVITSADAVPDPPAVNPHVLDFKIAGLRELPSAFDEQRLHCASLCLSLYLPLRQFDFTEMVKLNRSTDEMALVRYAADPSPPAFL